MTTPAQDKSIADVAAAFGGGSASTPTSGLSTDAFMQTLQDKLMGMSSMTSSDNTALDTALNSAIAQQTKAGEASRTATTLSYDRQISEAGQTGSQNLTSAEEAQRGFAVNTGLIRNIQETTDKNVKDLELRKQEALATGDAATANNLSQLQLKALEFKQTAQQNIFSNILNMGQLGLQKQAQENAASQFKQTLDLNKAQLAYTEDSDISKIATQFGLTVSPGETLASITNKAKPFASAEQKARLAALVDKNKVDNTQINVDGILQDAIMGTGSFKDLGPQSPAMAALSAANYMKSIGITPTASDINRFTQQATKLNSDYQTSLEKSKAEVVGNSFWGNFSNFFGGEKTLTAQEQLIKANNPYYQTESERANAIKGPAPDLRGFFSKLFGQ